jgi:transmembrane sensor
MNAISKSIRSEAAKWFLRLKDAEPDHPDRGMFESWLMQSALHRDAYQAIAQTWEDFDSPRDMRALADGMMRKKLDEDAQRKRQTSTLAKVASFAVLAIGVIFSYQFWQTQPLTQMAQTSQVGSIVYQTLDDGSQLTLGADSDVEIIYYRNKRLVNLKHGQAVFEVVKDASRPFVVASEDAVVTVKGTRFLVNRVDHKTVVAVDHGKVQVQALDADGNVTDGQQMLGAGEVAEVKLTGVQKVNRNAMDAFAFLQGKLMFDGASLNEVAETISRYRQTPLVDNSQSQASITAVVQIKDMEHFIQSLPQVAEIKMDYSTNKTILESQ